MSLKVLFALGLDNIEDSQGKRNDLDEIYTLLKDGLTPAQIMEQNFAYRKYEKMIRSAFLDMKIKGMPPVKSMHNEYHFGKSGSGKTFYYIELTETFGKENVYLCNDYHNGGFDFYLTSGAPPILFMDEFKGNMSYSQLLTTLDRYTMTQTHCRYGNTYNLWTSVIMTSIYPPEKLYGLVVDEENRQTDTFAQFLRRLDVIVYHYVADGVYETLSIPAKEYTGFQDMMSIIGKKRRNRPDLLLKNAKFYSSEQQKFVFEDPKNIITTSDDGDDGWPF